jgi:hypothetical protein
VTGDHQLRDSLASALIAELREAVSRSHLASANEQRLYGGFGYAGPARLYLAPQKRHAMESAMPADSAHWLELTEFAHCEPNALAFRALVALLDTWPADDQAAAIAYADKLLSKWPDAVRLAPLSWCKAVSTGAVPPTRPLVRALQLQTNGTYFFPAEFSDFTSKVSCFVGRLGGTFYRYPVAAGTTHGDKSVAISIKDGVSDLLGKYEEAIDEFDAETTERKFETQAEKLRIAKLKVEAYGLYLADEAAGLQARLDELTTKLREKIEANATVVAAA